MWLETARSFEVCLSVRSHYVRVHDGYETPIALYVDLI